MKSLKQYIASKLFRFITAKGTVVSPEHKAARLEACKKCPSNKLGEVSFAYKGIEYKDDFGCQQCGCLLQLKSSLATLGRLHPNEPLSVDEVIELQLSNQPLVQYDVTCELGHWNDVDKSFQQ